MNSSLKWYEEIQQCPFEDLVIDVLKEYKQLLTRDAFKEYNLLCNQVLSEDEKCRMYHIIHVYDEKHLDNNKEFYVLRKRIIDELKGMKIDLYKEYLKKNVNQ